MRWKNKVWRKKKGCYQSVFVNGRCQLRQMWTGTMNYSAPADDIRDLEGLHLEYMDNTVIETYDGDFLACGRGVGDQKATLATYYEASDFETVCSYEFLLLDWTEEMLREKVEQK